MQPDTARRNAAAALLAVPAALLAAGSADGATFAPGNYDNATFDKPDGGLIDVQLDIDGDGVIDGRIYEDDSSTYGDASELSVDMFEVDGFQNGVFRTDDFDVRAFATPDAVAQQDPADATGSGFIDLWNDGDYEVFEDPMIAGFVFEIPGGSPYYGFLEIEVMTEPDGSGGDVYTGFTILSSGFAPVPEPTAAIAGLGMIGGLSLRRRRGR